MRSPSTSSAKPDRGCLAFRINPGYIRQSPSGLGMQRHAVPFAVLEVGDEPMFTDAGLGHQRLPAVSIDSVQGALNVSHGEVDQGPGMGRRVPL